MTVNITVNEVDPDILPAGELLAVRPERDCQAEIVQNGRMKLVGEGANILRDFNDARLNCQKLVIEIFRARVPKRIPQGAHVHRQYCKSLI